MRQLMLRGCNLPLCCMRYHQACKMSLDQNVNVLTAPLGMTHTQQDTWHWIMEAREMQSLFVWITQILADFVWHGGHSALICLGPHCSLCSSVWNPWPELRLLTPASALELGSASLGTNKGAQQAPSFHFPKNNNEKINAGVALFWNVCDWQLLPSISRPAKSLYINCVVISVSSLMSPCLAVWETVSKYRNTTFFTWGSGVWLHQDIFISLYYFSMAFSNHSG